MTTLELRDIAYADLITDHRNIVAVIPYFEGENVCGGYIHDLIIDELNANINPIYNVDPTNLIEIASEIASIFQDYYDRGITDEEIELDIGAYIAIVE